MAAIHTVMQTVKYTIIHKLTSETRNNMTQIISPQTWQMIPNQFSDRVELGMVYDFAVVLLRVT